MSKRIFVLTVVSCLPLAMIAAQGSAFRDTLVAGIVADLKPRAVYVRVVDIPALPTVRENE